MRARAPRRPSLWFRHLGPAAQAPRATYHQGMAAQSGGPTLELERVLPAAPPLVFQAFADAGRLAKWWGPEGFRVGDVDFEPRPGAGYRIEMQPPEGDAQYQGGQFRGVEPPTRLAFTFAGGPPDAEIVPYLVELPFRDLEGAPEVRLAQGAFKNAARREFYRMG